MKPNPANVPANNSLIGLPDLLKLHNLKLSALAKGPETCMKGAISLVTLRNEFLKVVWAEEFFMHDWP